MCAVAVVRMPPVRWRSLRWRLLLAFIALVPVFLAGAGRVAAQSGTRVVVSIRDGADRGVDEVALSIRSADGAQLGQAVTDRDGVATIAVSAAPSSNVLLQVQGVIATGLPLQLAPTERDGIAIFVTGQTTTIALRVEDDGTVLPDPASMAEPAGAPLDPTSARPTPVPATPPPAAGAFAASPSPTLRRPAPSPIARALAPTTLPAQFVDANGQPVFDQPMSAGRFPLLMLLVGFSAGVIVYAAVHWLRRMRMGVQP